MKIYRYLMMFTGKDFLAHLALWNPEDKNLIESVVLVCLGN